MRALALLVAVVVLGAGCATSDADVDPHPGPGIVALASRADLVALVAVDDIVYRERAELWDGSIRYRYTLDLSSAVDAVPVTIVGRDLLRSAITVERDGEWSDGLEGDLSAADTRVLAFITDWRKVGTEKISIYVVGVSGDGSLRPVDGSVSQAELDTIVEMMSGSASIVQVVAEIGRQRNSEKGYDLGLPPETDDPSVLDALWPGR